MRKIISAVVGIGTIIWIWDSEIIGLSIAWKMAITVLLIIAMGLDIFDPHDIMKNHKNLINWFWVVFWAGVVLFDMMRLILSD